MAVQCIFAGQITGHRTIESIPVTKNKFTETFVPGQTFETPKNMTLMSQGKPVSDSNLKFSVKFHVL